MRNKIRIALCLVENFEHNFSIKIAEYHATGNYSPGIFNAERDAILEAIIPHFEKQAKDKEWYSRIAASFATCLREGITSHTWLVKEFKTMEIFQASEEFQKRNSGSFDCSAFLCYFFTGQDPSVPEYKNIVKQYYKNLPNHVTPIKSLDWQLGDLIINGNSLNSWNHATIYIGTKDNIKYGVSKYGFANDVFMHPINFFPENYGDLRTRFRYTKLSLSALRNIQKIRQELAATTAEEKEPEQEETIVEERWTFEAGVAEIMEAIKGKKLPFLLFGPSIESPAIPVNSLDSAAPSEHLQNRG